MSFPEFKEFDKAAREALEDGFDTGYSLAVNSKGPFGAVVGTTTAYHPGMTVFPNKLSLSWAHECGFALEKVELSSCDKVDVESSFMHKALPGMKFTFKGVESTAGTVGFVYNHKLATVTSDLDVTGFNSLCATALGGKNGFLLGGAASVALGGKFELKDYSLAAGWAPKEGIFAGIQANNKLEDLTGSVNYAVKPNLSVAALVDMEIKSKKTNFTVGADFTPCTHCGVKAKINNAGLIHATVKRNFESDVSLAATVGVDVNDLKGFKFGVNASLG